MAYARDNPVPGGSRNANDQGKVAINPGEIAEAQAGAAPTSRLLVKPRDAVQWSLYYPPILATSAGAGDAAPEVNFMRASTVPMAISIP